LGGWNSPHFGSLNTEFVEPVSGHSLFTRIWGRCYDDNFCDFHKFSAKKWHFPQKPMLCSNFCKN
jgi:hypothetical protein